MGINSLVRIWNNILLMFDVNICRLRDGIISVISSRLGGFVMDGSL